MLSDKAKKYLTFAAIISAIAVGVSIALRGSRGGDLKYELDKPFPFYKATDKKGYVHYMSSKYKFSKYPILWDTVLQGESRTFNDYNYYAPTLRGRINATDTRPFSSKKLTDMRISEVMGYQNRSRESSTGQLWATGRFQIIPKTLLGLINRGVGINRNDLYDERSQQKLADALIDGRPAVRNYLLGLVPDTKINLESAALEMSKEWSSIGVPYRVGSRRKNTSYYSSKGDVASVPTEQVQEVLRFQRQQILNSR